MDRASPKINMYKINAKIEKKNYLNEYYKTNTIFYTESN